MSVCLLALNAYNSVLHHPQNITYKYPILSQLNESTRLSGGTKFRSFWMFSGLFSYAQYLDYRWSRAEEWLWKRCNGELTPRGENRRTRKKTCLSASSPIINPIWNTTRAEQFFRNVQGHSFSTRPKKMRIFQRLFIRFWTCIYDYIPSFMKSMSILEEMLEMLPPLSRQSWTRRFTFAKLACKTSSLIAAISRRMLFSSSCMVRSLLA